MTLRWLPFSLVGLAWLLAAACSSDSGPAPGEGTGGKSSSTGGGSSTGGATSTGGSTGAGGFDPAMAAQCGIDNGTDPCKTCTAAICCDAIKGCLGDVSCKTAFDTYQSCMRQPNQVNPAGCLSAFTGYTTGDAGHGHQQLVGCIITTCPYCGGVEAF